MISRVIRTSLLFYGAILNFRCSSNGLFQIQYWYWRTSLHFAVLDILLENYVAHLLLKFRGRPWIYLLGWGAAFKCHLLGRIPALYIFSPDERLARKLIWVLKTWLNKVGPFFCKKLITCQYWWRCDSPSWIHCFRGAVIIHLLETEQAMPCCSSFADGVGHLARHSIWTAF